MDKRARDDALSRRLAKVTSEESRGKRVEIRPCNFRLSLAQRIQGHLGPPAYASPAGVWKDQTSHNAPAGYPKEFPSCSGVTPGEPYDSAGLRLTLRPPPDARSFRFDHTFYAWDYPDWICTPFVDFFVAMLTPTPAGLVDGNIAFDELGNPMSVTTSFFEA